VQLLLLLSVKSDIADVDIVMCATDIRPFDIVEGAGFQQFCRKILQIGKKYRDGIDIKQLLPAPRTVARHVPDMKAKMKDELIHKLHMLLSFGITLDLWTHERTQIHNITVMIHFIDTLDWMMNSRILATREMEGKKTGDNIRQTVDGVLKEFGIKMEQDDTTFITDNGSNVVAALHAPIKRISCSGHT